MSSTEHTPEDWADGKIRTRENNPIYSGSYTMDDYRREFKEAKGRKWVLSKEGREFKDRYLKRLNEEDDGPEAERYKMIVRGALSRYDGPRAWGHGFGNGWEPDETTERRTYYTTLYELTDEDAIESILTDIEMEAERWTFLDSIYDEVLQELSDHPEWAENEREIWGTYNHRDPQDADMPDAEKTAEDICESYGGRYLDGWIPDIRDPKDPNDWQECERIAIETIVSKFLEDLREQLEAARTYKATGKVPADRYSAIIAIIRTTRKIPTIGRDGEILALRDILDIGDAEGQASGTNEPDIAGYLWEITLSKPSDFMSVPHNDFMRSAWKALAAQQRFNDDGTLEIEKVKRILLESKKNKNDSEWLKTNIMTKGYEPLSFAEFGFIEQLGYEMEMAVKEGRPLVFTEKQLCKYRYGISPRNSVKDERCEEFSERFDELCNMKVLIPDRGEGHNIDQETKNERGVRLEKIIGKEVRLMDPKIEYRRTKKDQDNPEGVVKVYIFEDDRAPIHDINAWHGERARPRRDLLQTDAIPAEKLSEKGREHYEKENLRGRNKRSKDQLSLDSIVQFELKYCILYSIVYANGFTQKGKDRLVLNLEDIYKVIYRTPAPEKRNYKWKDYVKAVYTYLTFLIEKGAIEDYHPGKEFKKDSGIVFIDVDRGKNLLYPPQ